MSAIKTQALKTISETVSYPVEKEKKRIFFLDNLKIALVQIAGIALSFGIVRLIRKIPYVARVV